MIQFITQLFFLLFSISIYGQSNYGYIDYKKVAEAHPEHQTLQQRVESKAETLNDSLLQLEEKYRNFLTNEIPDLIEADSTYIKSIEGKLSKLDKDIDSFKLKAKTIINNEIDSMDMTLKTIISNDLNLFYKESDIVCITKKEAVLFCPQCIDYTDSFIDFITSLHK